MEYAEKENGQERIASSEEGEQRVKTIVVKDGRVSQVNYYKVVMSRRQKARMFIDLWIIAFVATICSIGVMLSFLGNSSCPVKCVVLALGVLSTLCSVGNAVSDFESWNNRVNYAISIYGNWLLEDAMALCGGTSAEAQVASESVEGK